MSLLKILFICLLLETYGTFWNLLEPFGKRRENLNLNLECENKKFDPYMLPTSRASWLHHAKFDRANAKGGAQLAWGPSINDVREAS